MCYLFSSHNKWHTRKPILSIQQQQWAAGKWIVHRQFGVGEIICREEKQISGESAEYFRVKTHDSLMWLPVDDVSEDWRSILSEDDFAEVIAVLQKPPKEMADHYQSRNGRINKARSENHPLTSARLIRDLRGRWQREGKLRNIEKEALRQLTRSLVQEWALSYGLKISTARKRLMTLLRNGKAAKDGEEPISIKNAFKTVQELPTPETVRAFGNGWTRTPA